MTNRTLERVAKAVLVVYAIRGALLAFSMTLTLIALWIKGVGGAAIVAVVAAAGGAYLATSAWDLYRKTFADD